MSALLTKETVQLTSDRQAVMVRAPASSDADEILNTLELDVPSPVLLICCACAEPGAAADAPGHTVVGQAIASAARVTGATVLDGGLLTSVNAEVGAARAADPRAVATLIGVAPAVAVCATDEAQRALEGGPLRTDTLEPHHTHLVVFEGGDRGEESTLVINLAASLSKGLPVALVLVGGGANELRTADEAAERGWPVIAVAGTGGAADDLAMASNSGRNADARLQAVRASGRLEVVPGADGPKLSRRLTWAGHPDAVLKDAWRLLATYDGLAVRLRRTFQQFQTTILALGVAATLLALLHQVLGTQALRWLVIIASITVGALIALSDRRATGKRWVTVRAAAEAVKSEIFRYRTRTGIYSDARLLSGGAARRAELLAARLDKVQARLMHGEVSSGSLSPYEGPLPRDGGADDGLTQLDAERYVELRLTDQISYYHRRVRSLERRRSVLQAVAVAASATGALVAAVGAETWVALTTAVGAAALAYLAHLQFDSTIVSYNQAAARLDAVGRRWHAHLPDSRSQRAFVQMVNETEAVMATERGGWIEQMTEALRELDDHERKHHQPAE